VKHGRVAVPRPFLKWAGGKGRLVPRLLKCAPDRFDRYFEPFAGGAALFFALSRESRLRGCEVVLSDVNRELIDTYEAVRDSLDEVVDCLRGHKYEREHFYAVREQDPWKLSQPRRAARMIFLNKTDFNGLYRVNSRGRFNVPFGRYKNPNICDEKNLRAVSVALQGVRLTSGPFDEVTGSVGEGDFVYFDPPYVRISATAGFVSYARLGFSIEDQRHLAGVFKRIAERGACVVLSNSDTPWVREQYAGYRLKRVDVGRAINSMPDRRGPVGELIVMS